MKKFSLCMVESIESVSGLETEAVLEPSCRRW